MHTWAEELEFEQVCTERVLETIFAEFDVDGDGVVSERDLKQQIYKLVTKG